MNGSVSKRSKFGRRFTLSLISEVLAIVRLEPVAAVPDWAMQGAFFSITRTHDELSIVCEDSHVPKGVESQRGWRALKVQGPFALSEVGVLASLATPLAIAGVSVLAIATYDTDYLLVSGTQLAAAIAALREAGHQIKETKGE